MIASIKAKYLKVIGRSPQADEITFYGVSENIPNFSDPNNIDLMIDLKEGKVLNWPKKVKSSVSICLKLVDSGKYQLISKQGNIVFTHEGYVPRELAVDAEGWSDYIIITIDAKGKIMGWVPPSKLSRYYEKELINQLIIEP